MSIIKTVLACAGMASIGYGAYKGVRLLMDTTIVIHNDSWDAINSTLLTARPGSEVELRADASGCVFPSGSVSESSNESHEA